MSGQTLQANQYFGPCNHDESANLIRGKCGGKPSCSCLFGPWTYHIFIYTVIVTFLCRCTVETRVMKQTTSPPVSKSDVEYLSKFGYLTGASRETANILNKNDLETSIRRFQRFAGIPQTGILDPRTKSQMRRPRCGNPDIIYPYRFHRRSKRFVLASSKWNHRNLTFKIVNYTSDLSLDSVRRAVYNAFAVWSKVTLLTFTEVFYQAADIEIQFSKRYHKDGYPFDGKGFVLAHAFFPGKKRGGDVHFDDDETWTINSNEGVDLVLVAAHEFGHALGLAHSDRPSALMHPFYDGFKIDFDLPYDDTIGIQHLYGVRRIQQGATTPPPLPALPTKPYVSERFSQPTRKPVMIDPEGSIPNPCEMDYDAVSLIRNDLHVFHKRWYWRFNENGVVSGYPIQIRRFWKALPSDLRHVDAVYEKPDDSSIVFFIGSRYWVFNANTLDGGFPKAGRPITDYGLPSDLQKIDAAFVWSYNQHVYLISGDMYWKLDKNGKAIYDYPRDISIWEGVPHPIHAAFQANDKKTYFFQGPYYWEFNDDSMSVQHAEGKPSSHRWFRCNNGVYEISHSLGLNSKSSADNLSFTQSNLLIVFITTIMYQIVFRLI